jgi:hypothetical protein
MADEIIVRGLRSRDQSVENAKAPGRSDAPRDPLDHRNSPRTITIWLGRSYRLAKAATAHNEAEQELYPRVVLSVQ